MSTLVIRNAETASDMNTVPVRSGMPSFAQNDARPPAKSETADSAPSFSSSSGWANRPTASSARIASTPSSSIPP